MQSTKQPNNTNVFFIDEHYEPCDDYYNAGRYYFTSGKKIQGWEVERKGYEICLVCKKWVLTQKSKQIVFRTLKIQENEFYGKNETGASLKWERN